MRKKAVTDAHAAFRAALMATMQEHAAKLPADEVLAVASHCVGRMLAMLDRQKYRPDVAMKLVLVNIEAGNRTVDQRLRDAPAAGSA